MLMITSTPLLTTILLSVALTILLSGCQSLPVESPICVPHRPVLVDLSVAEQLSIREETGVATLLTIATNDATLKSRVRLLEGLIEAHDSPLGSCD